jgi:hypothetical protein
MTKYKDIPYTYELQPEYDLNMLRGTRSFPVLRQWTGRERRPQLKW